MSFISWLNPKQWWRVQDSVYIVKNIDYCHFAQIASHQKHRLLPGITDSELTETTHKYGISLGKNKTPEYLWNFRKNGSWVMLTLIPLDVRTSMLPSLEFTTWSHLGHSLKSSPVFWIEWCCCYTWYFAQISTAYNWIIKLINWIDALMVSGPALWSIISQRQRKHAMKT